LRQILEILKLNPEENGDIGFTQFIKIRIFKMGDNFDTAAVTLGGIVTVRPLFITAVTVAN